MKRQPESIQKSGRDQPKTSRCWDLHSFRQELHAEWADFERMGEIDDALFMCLSEEMRCFERMILGKKPKCPLFLALQVEVLAYHEDWRTPEQLQLLKNAQQLFDAA